VPAQTPQLIYRSGDWEIDISRRDMRFGGEPGIYSAFHTGPLATADIEGVLIHGAQGVRSLCVLPLALGRR
jgi:L-lactate utilization protein LutC